MIKYVTQSNGGNVLIAAGVGAAAFVNAAFLRLLEHVPFSQVKSTLSFTQSTRQINQLIKSRFEFVSQQDIGRAPEPPKIDEDT